MKPQPEQTELTADDLAADDLYLALEAYDNRVGLMDSGDVEAKQGKPAFEPSNWPAMPGFAKNRDKRRPGGGRA